MNEFTAHAKNLATDNRDLLAPFFLAFEIERHLDQELMNYNGLIQQCHETLIDKMVSSARAEA